MIGATVKTIEVQTCPSFSQRSTEIVVDISSLTLDFYFSLTSFPRVPESTWCYTLPAVRKEKRDQN
jgi:hypothetical protein